MSSAAPTHLLVTWNSQGDPRKKGKVAALQDVLKGSENRVVFIQEGGVGDGGFAELAKDFSIASGASVGAKNERCTAYVLCDAKLKAKPVTLTTGNQSVLIAGGEAGRTGAAAAVGRTLFISWHSTANMTTQSTADLVGALLKNPTYTRDYDTIVIGGDFNAVPADMLTSLKALKGEDRATLSRYSLRNFNTAFEITVYASGKNTQGGKSKDERELDYFIVLTNPKTSHFIGGPPVVVPVDPSDHNPVVMQCSFG